MARPELAVRMTGITKRFQGVTANDRVDMDVRRGEIHGLLGENGAGKTTLMRILYGLLQPDAGAIEVSGRAVTIPHPKAARRLGIAMVHQHFMLVPNMTVADNVALVARGRSPLAPTHDAARLVVTLTEEFGFGVAPEELIEDLSVGRQQQVEILKALCTGGQTLILDEPTASLMPAEWGHLSAVLRTLADAGSSVIFITHKLGELLRLADRCTVLRDGRVVGASDVSDVDEASLARMMVGRDVVLRVERQFLAPGHEVLDVSNLMLVSPDDGRERLRHLDFTIREKEILGVAGVEGNGQSELVDVLTGLRQPTAGRIVIDGVEATRLTPRAFTGLGGALIPEDRHRTGVALELDVSDNLIMKEAATRRFSRRGFLVGGAVEVHSQELIRAFDIRVPRPDVLMRQLSGGNQQKAVVARELSRKPKLLIAAQPTRGLDVGATEFVYREILKHRARGGATLLISNELDEILSLSDRIAVMADGQFTGVMDSAEATPDKLGLLMAGEAA